MKKKATTAKKVAPFKPQGVDVIIETPKGCRNKFAYDPSTGLFKLSKILAEGMMFPYDFGFAPNTKADDGDPIDLLVLVEETTFPGCLVECDLIGVIEATQEEKTGGPKRNPRLIGVAR
jgi:inorganic pyrophosphatase